MFPGGACDQLMQRLVYTPDVQLFVSPFMLTEFARVASQKLALPPRETERALRTIREIATIIEPQERLTIVREKDDDNRILECALAAAADLLITGDTKHLLPLHEVRGIPIRSPREARDRWFSA